MSIQIKRDRSAAMRHQITIDDQTMAVAATVAEGGEGPRRQPA